MNETLRPSTLGEILDRTANLYRSRFWVFFGMGAVPAAIVLGFGGGMVLLFAWTGSAAPEATLALGLGVLALSLLGLPLMLGSNALSGAALCDAASSLAMGGAITISTAFQRVWRRGWQYVGLYLLQMLIIVGAPFAVWLVLLTFITAAAVMARGGGFLPGLLMFVSIFGLGAYAVWMLLRLCLAFPVAVVEQAGMGVALKRAATLSRGTRWRMLVLFLLGTALAWVGSLILMVPLTVALALVPGMSSPQHAQLAGTVVLIGFYGASFVVQGLTMPVYAIALVLFYYDQRVRQEGFDVELLMREAGMLPDAAPQAGTVAWMPERAVPAAETAARAMTEPPAQTEAGTSNGAALDAESGAA